MSKTNRGKTILLMVHRFMFFFAFIAIVITCCMMLFVSTLAESMGIELTNEYLHTAAKLTFANVILLSLLWTLLDEIRRKIVINRPIERITSAAEKIMAGDFKVKIAPVKGAYGEENFNEIIDCMNKMAEELAGIETLQTDFIANVSHELKTPLAVMQNYATMLQQPDLEEAKRMEYAKVIAEATRKFADLITNILKLNKLENQQISPSRTKYDLGEQFTQSLLQYEDVWERKKIAIDAEIEDGITVYADAELLSLVWNNLLSNAFKFTEADGTVSVKLKAEETFAYVEVTDTGCGMTKEVGEHIFEKFYQGDLSHSSQGNGLGLALVKRVIDITGCDISVRSENGKGTSFMVKVPRRTKDG